LYWKRIGKGSNIASFAQVTVASPNPLVATIPKGGVVALQAAFKSDIMEPSEREARSIASR
jgi:hypothetical protein